MGNQEHRPPRWADRFLEWYCHPDLLEEIQGDIYEVFERRFQTQGKTTARRKFVWDVIRSFRLSTIKNIHLNLSAAMLKNHFKITVRHLLKEKFYTTIKVAGLSIGIATCLLILIFIQNELSFDKYYPNAKNIYRVGTKLKMASRGIDGKYTITTTPLAKTLEQDFPEIEKAIRIAPNFYEAGSNLVKKEGEDQNVRQEGFVYADPGFISMFDFPMIQGDGETALDKPFTMVLTASMAEKYFPGENPMGKVFYFNNNMENPFKVTGVMEDLPKNSHFNFNVILSMEGLSVSKVDNWGHSNYVTYVTLNPQANPAELEAKIQGIVKTYIDPEIDQKRKQGDDNGFFLQPVTDIHLQSSELQGIDYARTGDMQYIWLFGTVAIFLLIIASINFINLSTARSANRAKEVGIRKVLGSLRKQLVSQFLTESVMLSIIAVLVSVLLAWIALPYFNNLAGQQLTFPFTKVWFIASLSGVALLIGLLSGIYPSVFLSSFVPAQVLKGKVSQGSKSGWLQSTLVIIQFTTSITLIAATLIVKQQMNFIQNKKLGFDRNQVLIIEDTYAIGYQIQSFKNELEKFSEVEHVSSSSFLPVDGYDKNGASAWPANNHTPETEVGLYKWYVDQQYVETLGMQMVEGRDFSMEFPSDSQAIILNKKAVELLGFENPVGEKVSSYSSVDEVTGKMLYDTYTVIGVVEDFNFESMKNDIYGLTMVIGNSAFASSTMVKVRTADMQQVLGKVGQLWKKYAPNEPFRYNFLNEQFSNMYRYEQKVGQIFAIFAGIAIFVACLGLFALAAFMAEQRTKEIGIRKVLGASVSSILLLLTKNFMVMVLISLFLATPLGWYFMHAWLEDYAYKININWTIFAIAGGITFLVAFLTISYQALHAAVLNPAKTLHSE